MGLRTVMLCCRLSVTHCRHFVMLYSTYSVTLCTSLIVMQCNQYTATMCTWLTATPVLQDTCRTSSHNAAGTL